MPVALQVLLVAGLLFYTTSRFPGFVNAYNVQQILILALPLIVAAMAQTHAILVGYLDLSVGGMIGLGVVIASFLIGDERFPPPDPVRDRRHPGLRRRPRPRQCGPDPGTQDPLDHRHPGHAEHPGRDLADDATDGAGRHQPWTDLRAHREHRADPRGVHRHRRGSGSRRSLAPRFRIGSGAEGRRLRRPVGQTGRGQDQPAPGPGPRPVGRAGGRGRVLRHGPVPDRERDRSDPPSP